MHTNAKISEPNDLGMQETLSTSHDYSKLYMIGIVPVQINVARMCGRQIMFPSQCLGQAERP